MTSRALAEAVGEEVPDGRFDRGPRIAVPVHPQHQLLMVGGASWRPVLRLRAEKRDPDVGDDARPLGVQQHMRRARRDVEVVPVALDVGVAARIGLRIVPALPGVALSVRAAADLAHPHRRRGAHGPAGVRPGQVAERARATAVLGAAAPASAGPDERGERQGRHRQHRRNRPGSWLRQVVHARTHRLALREIVRSAPGPGTRERGAACQRRHDFAMHNGGSALVRASVATDVV